MRCDPLCLVVMPFDKKKDATGRVVDFEAVYRRLLLPAVEAAGLRPVRGDEARAGCLMEKAVLERLKLCDFVLFDLTTADASVFYQWGVRSALHPGESALCHAAGTAQLPVEAQQLSAVPYRVSPHGLPVHEAKYRALLTERLRELRESPAKGEVHRLLQSDGQDEERREQVAAREGAAALWKQRLERARMQGVAAVQEVEAAMGEPAEADLRVLLDLFLSYRAASGWQEMIALAGRLPGALSRSVLVQEQLGLALNWAGRGEEAEQVLRELIVRRGPCSESYGILGRVLKDRWEKELPHGDSPYARELLQKAAAAYLKGFESDWRNTYPGVNAVTLMELREPADPRRREILPVVHYAVEQRIRSGAADYWDYATLLELAALSCNEAKGIDALGRSLARVREAWEPETTARDLRLIREARQRRGADCPEWTERAERELLKAAQRGTARP